MRSIVHTIFMTIAAWLFMLIAMVVVGCDYLIKRALRRPLL